MGIILKTWKLISLLLAVSGVIYSLHSGLERHRYTRQQQEFSFLPSADHVRLLSMGHTETAASLLWVRGIIYFGESLMNQTNTVWMEHLIDLVTTADPHFKQAYLFSSTALQAKDMTEKSLKIQRNGVELFPDWWQLSLYYAMNLTQGSENYSEAADVMDHFKNSKSVPKYITTISESFRRRTVPIGEGLHLYLSDYFNQNDKQLRKNQKNKILFFLTNTLNVKSRKQFDELFIQFESGSIISAQLYQDLLTKKKAFDTLAEKKLIEPL